MAVSSSAVSPARSEKLDDFETLQTLVVFSGVGLLLTVNGWI
jgi:hypothetical protein